MKIREMALMVGMFAPLVTVWPQAPGETADGPRAKTPEEKPTLCHESCEFADLSAAIRAASPGSVVSVAPGTYGTCGVVDKPLQLIGLMDASGNRAHLVGTLCEGKAPLVLRASDVVIEGLEISNVTAPDKNGACIRIDPEAGDVTIRNLYCHDSEEGILGGPKRGSVIVEDSRFERNGENATAHGIYINQGDNFILRSSQVIATKGKGHTVKSGAKRTVIEDSVLAALDGHNSRAIDLYAGGVLELRRSVIEQGKNSDNHDAIGVALEPSRINPPPHSTLVEDSWIIFDGKLERCCRWLIRANQLGPIMVHGNKIVGMTSLSEPILTISVENNRLYRDREEAGLPKYDGSLSSLPQPGS